MTSAFVDYDQLDFIFPCIQMKKIRFSIQGLSIANTMDLLFYLSHRISAND